MYAIAEKCKSLAAEIYVAIAELECAKTDVNINQLGVIPDAISSKLDKLIEHLNVAITALENAAGIAIIEAQRLAEEERKSIEETARKKAETEAKRKKIRTENAAKSRTFMEN